VLPIKVGFLVSYDYNLLKDSIPLIYEGADKIVLAIDKKRLTWSGNPIYIDSEFFEWLKKIDLQKKIELYEDNFFVPELKPIECETRERNMLAKFIGDGGWHIQIDCDEYFIDFNHFVKFLHNIEKKSKRPVSVKIQWLDLYKKTADNYLFIQNGGGYVPVATTTPHYFECRYVNNTKEFLYSQRVIHESWARTEQDLWVKITNWGHATSFDVEGYFHYWKAIDDKNYMFARNIHPLVPEAWSGLNKVNGKNIKQLIQNIKTDNSLIKARKESSKFKKLKLFHWFIPPIFPKLYEKIFRLRKDV
jgi:hypothetical protein